MLYPLLKLRPIIATASAAVLCAFLFVGAVHAQIVVHLGTGGNLGTGNGEIKLGPRPVPASIQGKVSLPNGKPAPGIHIDVRRVQEYYETMRTDGGPSSSVVDSTVTNTKGQYILHVTLNIQTAMNAGGSAGGFGPQHPENLSNMFAVCPDVGAEPWLQPTAHYAAFTSQPNQHKTDDFTLKQGILYSFHVHDGDTGAPTPRFAFYLEMPHGGKFYLGKTNQKGMLKLRLSALNLPLIGTPPKGTYVEFDDDSFLGNGTPDATKTILGQTETWDIKTFTAGEMNR
jgi:hypothetical protein